MQRPAGASAQAELPWGDSCHLSTPHPTPLSIVEGSQGRRGLSAQLAQAFPGSGACEEATGADAP